MRLLLTLTLLVLTLLPAGAVKKFEANPINVAVVSIEKTDSAKVASTCEYYGFAYQGDEEGYTIMKNRVGNEIRFTFRDNGVTQKSPTVIVKTNESHKDIENRLKELNFEKDGNAYTSRHNQFTRFFTQCSIGPDHSLIFRKIQNPAMQK